MCELMIKFILQEAKNFKELCYCLSEAECSWCQRARVLTNTVDEFMKQAKQRKINKCICLCHNGFTMVNKDTWNACKDKCVCCGIPPAKELSAMVKIK